MNLPIETDNRQEENARRAAGYVGGAIQVAQQSAQLPKTVVDLRNEKIGDVFETLLRVIYTCLFRRNGTERNAIDTTLPNGREFFVPFGSIGDLWSQDGEAQFPKTTFLTSTYTANGITATANIKSATANPKMK
uniref:Uncharacterized protein n=1 Tax=Romanomermis culicivorax TaxID=13658 RepID=A0A915HHJ0_ROMCU